MFGKEYGRSMALPTDYTHAHFFSPPVTAVSLIINIFTTTFFHTVIYDTPFFNTTPRCILVRRMLVQIG